MEVYQHHVEERGMRCVHKTQRVLTAQESILAVVKELAQTRTTPHLCELGQRFGFTWMAVNSVAELFHDKQLRFREFFQTVEHPELGRTFEYAGPGAEFIGDPWQIRRRPPLLGEHEASWRIGS